MAISKVWNIESVEVLNNFLQYQNVVRKINWKLTIQNDGIDGNLPQTIHLNGTVNINFPYDLTTYKNFDTLTETEMLDWVFSALGNKKYDVELEAEQYMLSILMSNDSSMVVENKPLPWSNTQ